TRSRTLRVDGHLGSDRPACASRFERDLGQGQRLEAAGVGAGRPRLAVLPFDRVRADVPHHRRAFLQLLDDLLGGLVPGSSPSSSSLVPRAFTVMAVAAPTNCAAGCGAWFVMMSGPG